MNRQVTLKRMRSSQTTPNIKDEMVDLHRVYFLEQIEEISLDIKKILLTEGYYPVPFKNSNEMLEYSMENPPSVYFVSVSQPDGIQAIQQIKREENLQHVFVIASGVKRSQGKMATEAGAEIYLPKPYIWRILPYTIHSLIFITNLNSNPSNQESNEVTLAFTPNAETIAEIQF